MRDATFDAITNAEQDDLLTTGEAAAILNSSRQHVVDLCNRGELPFSTVGTHRRVTRADVEALRVRTQTLTRDQERTLWLAYATAGRIVEDPTRARLVAHANLAKMEATSRGQTKRWLDEWRRLVDGPTDQMLALLVARSPKGRELRQNAPFAGLMRDDERRAILDAWRARDSHRTR